MSDLAVDHCDKCGRYGEGLSLIHGWNSYPEGWFMKEFKDGTHMLVCCAACAEEVDLDEDKKKALEGIP